MHHSFADAGRLSKQHYTVLLMAVGIFPEDHAAAVVIRDVAGNPTYPPEVEKAYSPSPAFLSTCLMTALPSNCEARIEPRQINAIVSELVAFAECMDPNGPWDCAALNNLCAAFNAWVELNMVPLIVADTPPPAPVKLNQQWWESDTGMLWLWYNDGNTQQWVQMTPGKIYMDGISIRGLGISTNPHEVGIVDC